MSDYTPSAEKTALNEVLKGFNANNVLDGQWRIDWEPGVDGGLLRFDAVVDLNGEQVRQLIAAYRESDESTDE